MSRGQCATEEDQPPGTSWRGLGCSNPSPEVRARESSNIHIQHSETRSRSHMLRPSGSSKDSDRKKKYLDA